MKTTSILVIIIVILAAGLAYSAFFGNKAIAPQNSPSPSPSSIFYAPNEWKTWADNYCTKGGACFSYSIKYPRDFDVNSGDRVSGGLLVGTPLVKIAFPQDAYQAPKTNFGEAYISLTMATDAPTIANCFSIQGNQSLNATATINGVQFKTGHTTDAAAGNIYDSQVYRAVFDNCCFEAVETVHTGNIVNYTPGTVTEFDKSKALVILDQMLQTLILSDKALGQ